VDVRDGMFTGTLPMFSAREAYEDYDEPGRKRHLLRPWIAVSDTRCRPLADALAGRYR